jgi:glycosyltransferase involved in cell wall biosynthesis
MEILFVGSGTDGGAIVRAQGESLRKSGVHVDYLFLNRGGFRGYFQGIFRLRTALKAKHYDLVHSHYLLSSIVSTLATRKKLIVSLMGSDVFDSWLFRLIIRVLHYLCWEATIVKSAEMKEKLGLEKVEVIPNGVDLENFGSMSIVDARKELGWGEGIYILFGSNPERKEKNFELTEQAFSRLKMPDARLVPLKNIPHEKIRFYLNACDLMLLTSFYEGSPNIVKEAMACNCPLVSTDVGDVRWLTGQTAGCFIAAFDAEDVAEKIREAAAFRKTHLFTEGRKALASLGLDSASVATRLIGMYRKAINDSKV